MPTSGVRVAGMQVKEMPTPAPAVSRPGHLAAPAPKAPVVFTAWFDGCPEDNLVRYPEDRWHTLIFAVSPEADVEQVCSSLLAADHRMRDAAVALNNKDLCKWAPPIRTRKTKLHELREGHRTALREHIFPVMRQARAQVWAWSFRDRVVDAIWPKLCETVKLKPYSIIPIDHGPTRKKILVKGHHDWPRVEPQQFRFLVMMADAIETMDRTVQQAWAKEGRPPLDRWDLVTDYLAGDDATQDNRRQLLLRLLHRIHPNRFQIYTRGDRELTNGMRFADNLAGLLNTALNKAADPAWDQWWAEVADPMGHNDIIWQHIGSDFMLTRVDRKLAMKTIAPAVVAAGAGEKTAGQPREMPFGTDIRMPLAPSAGPGSVLSNPAVASNVTP